MLSSSRNSSSRRQSANILFSWGEEGTEQADQVSLTGCGVNNMFIGASGGAYYSHDTVKEGGVCDLQCASQHTHTYAHTELRERLTDQDKDICKMAYAVDDVIADVARMHMLQIISLFFNLLRMNGSQIDRCAFFVAFVFYQIRSLTK